MAPTFRSIGLRPGERRYLSSERELRLGVCFWFRLFNVVPETTARFSYIDNRSRSQSPPWFGSLADRAVSPFIVRPKPDERFIRPGSGPATLVDLLGGPGRLPFGVPGDEHVALVVEATALGQGDLHFGLAILEVELDRDDGQGLLLGLPQELV